MAKEVQTSPRLPQAEIADMLDRLVARSLVQSDFATGRYTLLETIASYGDEHMEASERSDSGRRFEDYFLSIAGINVESGANVGTPEFKRIDDDIENFRAILKSCSLDRERHERGLTLALRLCQYWDEKGLHREACWWLDQFALDTVPKAAACEACYWSGAFARRIGNVEEAAQLLNVAGELAREVGNQSIEARCFSLLAICKLTAGDTEDAIELDSDAIVAARKSRDTSVIASVLNSAGETLRYAGNNFAARTLYEESASLAEELGDNHQLAKVTGNLSQVSAAMGDFSAALSYGIQAHDLASNRFLYLDVSVLIQVAGVLIYLGNI